MERLDKLVVYETDKGNHAVRPLNWAGIWDKDGKIKECGLNHIAVFHYKEDADWYANTKNAEEQGLLLRLPCKVGDIIWNDGFGKLCSFEVTGFSFGDLNDESLEVFDKVMIYYKNSNGSISGSFGVSELGKTVFTTREEAEQALKQMGE